MCIVSNWVNQAQDLMAVTNYRVFFFFGFSQGAVNQLF